MAFGRSRSKVFHQTVRKPRIKTLEEAKNAIIRSHEIKQTFVDEEPSPLAAEMASERSSPRSTLQIEGLPKNFHESVAKPSLRTSARLRHERPRGTRLGPDGATSARFRHGAELEPTSHLSDAGQMLRQHAPDMGGRAEEAGCAGMCPDEQVAAAGRRAAAVINSALREKQQQRRDCNTCPSRPSSPSAPMCRRSASASPPRSPVARSRAASPPARTSELFDPRSSHDASVRSFSGGVDPRIQDLPMSTARPCSQVSASRADRTSPSVEATRIQQPNSVAEKPLTPVECSMLALQREFAELSARREFAELCARRLRPESAPPNQSQAHYNFYAVNYEQRDNRLGQVYSAVARFLHKERQSDWRPRTSLKGYQQCHLVLGEAQARGVEWAKLKAFRDKPLVNFYSGFQCLCRKTLMAQNLRSYAAHSGNGMPRDATKRTLRLDDFLPRTFVFSKHCKETAQFIHEYRRREKEGSGNVWICKPSGGAHGINIVVLRHESDILQFLSTQMEKGTAWVVQKYLENPLLLPGQRKFDVRCMVLVTHDYSIYLYSEGTIRTCSTPFSLDRLEDRFAHLANNCLQEQHPDFGTFEDLNLMSYGELDEFLQGSGQVNSDGQPVTLHTHILPQIEAQVVYSLLAVKDQMQEKDGSHYRCFNLLGYDFVLDDRCNVHLLEVNSSPATDPRLIPKLVEEVVRIAVDPVFPPQAATVEASHSSGDGSGVFKLIYKQRKQDAVETIATAMRQRRSSFKIMPAETKQANISRDRYRRSFVRNSLQPAIIDERML